MRILSLSIMIAVFILVFASAGFILMLSYESPWSNLHILESIFSAHAQKGELFSYT